MGVWRSVRGLLTGGIYAVVYIKDSRNLGKSSLILVLDVRRASWVSKSLTATLLPRSSQHTTCFVKGILPQHGFSCARRAKKKYNTR